MNYHCDVDGCDGLAVQHVQDFVIRVGPDGKRRENDGPPKRLCSEHRRSCCPAYRTRTVYEEDLGSDDPLPF